MARILPISPTSRAPLTHEWWEDGACIDKPTEMFEVQEGVSRERQTILLLKGQVVCASCPVQDTCLNEATGDDLLWTMRGGVMPKRLNPAGRGRPRLHDPTEPCPEGHMNWSVVPGPNGRFASRCRDCDNARRRARRKSGTMAV